MNVWVWAWHGWQRRCKISFFIIIGESTTCKLMGWESFFLYLSESEFENRCSYSLVKHSYRCTFTLTFILRKAGNANVICLIQNGMNVTGKCEGKIDILFISSISSHIFPYITLFTHTHTIRTFLIRKEWEHQVIANKKSSCQHFIRNTHNI